MSGKRSLFIIVFALAAMLGALGDAAQAQGEVHLTVTCRCVTGGVNNTLAVWLNDFVIPTFEERMAEAGQTITVELVEFDGSEDQFKEQFKLDLRAGSGADVVAFDGFWIPEFVAAELLKPLEEIAGEAVNDWDGWTHMPEGIQALVSFQGARYGIALGADVRGIFYRRDLFEQAGITLPWQPTSWQELLDTARQLKEAGIPSPLQINAGTAMGEATTSQGYLMLLLGAGENMYDFDQEKWIVSSPAILDALNFYKTVYIDEQLGDAQKQLLPDARDRSFQAFHDGRIAMLVESDFFWRLVVSPNGSAGMDNRNEVVDWAKMPAIEPGRGYHGQDFVTLSTGTGWILNPNTQHPAEAWTFLAFMSDRDALRARELMQPRISIRDDVRVAGDPVMTAMADALLPITTVRPQLSFYTHVSNAAQLMTERVVSGEMSPQEAMDAYAQDVAGLVGEDNVIQMPLE